MSDVTPENALLIAGGGLLGTAAIGLMFKRFLLKFTIDNTAQVAVQSQADIINIVMAQFKAIGDHNIELATQYRIVLESLNKSTSETIALREELVRVKIELSSVKQKLLDFEHRNNIL
jgi:hypothetical protein